MEERDNGNGLTVKLSLTKTADKSQISAVQLIEIDCSGRTG
jgi:hypothetical protein